MTKNFKIINDDNTQLRNEKLSLQKQVSVLEQQLLSYTLNQNQNQGLSSGHTQKIKMGGHSPMNANRGTIEPKNSMASPASPVAGKDSSNPETAMGLPKSQETQRTLDSSTNSQTQTPQNKDIWDSLGEPDRHFDYLVKYNPSPSNLDPLPSFSNTNISYHNQTQETHHLDSISSCNNILDQIEQTHDTTQSSPKKKKSKKKIKKPKNKIKNEINKIIQEVIRDFVPKYTEDKVTEDAVLEDRSSSPNQDQDGYYSDGGYSFDSVARHNLDT